jgi:hypothetical protein
MRQGLDQTRHVHHVPRLGRPGSAQPEIPDHQRAAISGHIELTDGGRFPVPAAGGMAKTPLSTLVLVGSVLDVQPRSGWYNRRVPDPVAEDDMEPPHDHPTA